eukprot:snap_masked-scaffold_11-processed-gene-12.22-mRNA-1 protein AED:1.00 eAED:1.00 QI:0/0/0/0/1/1/2/0/291
MYYDELKPRQFCLVENLLLKIQENSRSTIPIEINIWIKNETQRDAEFIDKTVSKLRPIVKNSPRILRLQFSKFEDQNKANAARLAIIFKYGGLYMDLDFVTFQDPTILRSPFLSDGASKQLKKKFNNAMFRFTNENRKILIWMMKFFVSNYDGDKWGNNGPQMFTKFFSGESNACTYNKTHINCSDDLVLKIWPTAAVYPIYFMAGDVKLFKSDYKSFLQVFNKKTENSGSFFVHLWHKITKKYEIASCKLKDSKEQLEFYLNTSIGTLKSNFCPSVFEIMKQTSLPNCDF